MAGVKQAAFSQRRENRRESAPNYIPVDQRPANQNKWSIQPEIKTGFLGSAPFWAGFLVSALCIGAGVAINVSSSMQAAAEIAPQIGMISVLLQPLMLVAMIWAVAFTVHRARVQDQAVTRLLRASDRLFQPADRAIDEISNLQDALTSSLEAIDGKIYEVIERGDHLSQRLYEVFKDINQLSEANHDDVKAIIEQAEERRHFLQHANLMITSEANYELERNSSNVKHVLQSLKSEIDTFMARLSKDTAMMREIVGFSANEAEVVKIITEDLRTIVNSSYRVVQTAVEEGRSMMEGSLSEVQQANEERIRQTGDNVVRQLREHADAVAVQLREHAEGVVVQLQEVAQNLQASLEQSSANLLAALQERTQVSAETIETTARKANDEALEKLTESITSLHSRITGAVVEASSNLDLKFSSVLQDLDNQRVKAINLITEKIVTMPDSMRAAADEAIELIDLATEKTISAFQAAADEMGNQTQDSISTVDQRVQLVQNILLDVQGKIEEMDMEMRKSLAETGEGVRKSKDETRAAIADIKANYMARLSHTIAQLSALTVAPPTAAELAEPTEEASKD